MSTFNWNPEYEVGNIVIDEQNKHFLSLIEDLSVADHDTLVSVLDELMIYAETHFDDEEDVLDSIEYPELSEHKEMHQQFIKHVGEMIGKLYAETITAEMVQEELIQWFIQHISVEDASYRALLKGEEMDLDTISEFAWKERYSLGNSEIDEQHKKLFELINSVPDANESQLLTIVDEISRYVAYHFTSEEKLMKEINYPEMDEHIMEHRALIEEAKELRENGNAHTLSKENLYQILKEWLLHHILTIDMKMKPYLQ